MSFYKIYRYADNLFANRVLAGGESFVRKDDIFLKSSEWTYEYDSAGRLSAITSIGLLHLDFRPTREEATERYEYDDQDRLNRIVRSDGGSYSLSYDSRGDVVGTALRSPDGPTLTSTHTYGPGRNPFTSLGFHGGNTQSLSEHDLIRSENRVEGSSSVVSSLELQVTAYTLSGHPTGWVETRVNANNPDEPESRAVTLIYVGQQDEPT